MDKKQVKEDRAACPRHSGRQATATIALGLGGFILALSYFPIAVNGQDRPPPPPEIHIPPPVQQPAPPPATPPPIVLPTPPSTFVPPIVVPTDVTNPQITNPNAASIQSVAYLQSMEAFALAGIESISAQSFPSQGKVGKNFDWITVLEKDGAAYNKPNAYTADLKNGDIIVSVKNPSHLAFVNTPYGDIAIGANSDVMVSYNQGVLRLLNFDGEGRVIKVRLDKGPFAGPADPTVTIAPGYELVASDKMITRAELHPRDGIARRFGKTLDKGHLSICQFSLESAAHNIGMLVNLQQTTTGIKERRIISDLSKMAAVLNYKSGDTGYTP
jgi:hypothetical protein